MVKIVLLVVICMLLVSPLNAQSAPYCGKLTDDDCALLLDAQQSSLGMRSAILNQATFTLGEGMDIVFNVTGNVTNLRLLKGQRLLVLDDLQAALTVSVDLSSVSNEVYRRLQLDSMAVRLVDGNLYLDLDSLEPNVPTLHGWVSIDLKSRMPDLGQVTSTPSPSASVVTGTDLEQLIATFSPDVLNEFVTMTRQGDVFETQVDFATMYAHPLFQTTLREQLLKYWRRYGRTNEITDANLAHLASEIADLFPDPMTVYAITVDPETRTATTLQYWGLDGLITMIDVGASGGDTGGWEPGTISLSLNFDDADTIAPITVPEDVQPMTEAVLRDVPIIPFLFGFDIH